MDRNAEMRKRVEDAVTQFARKYLSVRPGEIIVDLHDSHVLIALRQVVCPAEREYARERNSRELLEKLLSRTFDAVKTELETEIGEITGRGVQQSRLNVDPPTGDAILVFFMEGPKGPREGGRET